MSTAMAALDCVTDARRGAVLLHPLRARILTLAYAPVSATQLARHLGRGRQQVNYHVRELAKARFLRRAGRVRKRNMIEQRYVASARSFVLAPSILRPLHQDAGHTQDHSSADRLLALGAAMQTDVASALHGAKKAGKRLATLSLTCDVRFASPKQRARFAEELQRSIVDLVARHSAPSSDASARPFRLMVGCYPVAVG
jgi:hypothetical protein